MNLYACIERKEPRLSNGWDLRSILHVEKDERRALTVIVGEIDGLRLQICQYGLDGRAEGSGLRGRVAGLNGNVDFQKKSHGFSPMGLVSWIQDKSRKMFSTRRTNSRDDGVGALREDTLDVPLTYLCS